MRRRARAFNSQTDVTVTLIELFQELIRRCVRQLNGAGAVVAMMYHTGGFDWLARAAHFVLRPKYPTPNRIL